MVTSATSIPDSLTVRRILDATLSGRRLSADDATLLLRSRDLAAIGRAAHAMTMRLHPEPYRTYNIDRNINYTNICTAVCDFCAFYRKPEIILKVMCSIVPSCCSKSSRRRWPNSVAIKS